jgi:hypothetical protein
MEECTTKEGVAGMKGMCWKMMEMGALRGLHSYRQVCHADREGMTLMMTNNNHMAVHSELLQGYNCNSGEGHINISGTF